ncbi:MAG: hypothetical protein Q7T89_03710 [Anaerolineales bacterium]|nr:hypothetical protein [Anaerolineales bacterium]
MLSCVTPLREQRWPFDTLRVRAGKGDFITWLIALHYPTTL